MRRLLLTVWAILAAATPALLPAKALTQDQAQTPDQAQISAPPSAPAQAQSPAGEQPPATANPPASPAPPAARLIKPRQTKGELHPPDKPRPRLAPLDERCRPLKQQLENELAHSDNPRKAFQARVAHNAGTRLCRDGQVEKGMAELRKGLSYLEAVPQTQP